MQTMYPTKAREKEIKLWTFKVAFLIHRLLVELEFGMFFFVCLFFLFFVFAFNKISFQVIHM